MQCSTTLKLIVASSLVVRPISTSVNMLRPNLSVSLSEMVFQHTSACHHKSTSAVQVGYPPSPQRAPLSLRPVSCQLVALSKPFHLSDARIGGVHDRRVREVVEMRLRD